MPTLNTVKELLPNTYYHAYNRGYNGQPLFQDEEDYRVFIYLLRKYLEPGFQMKRFTPKGEEYWETPNFLYPEIELVSFVLMSNHFHFLFYQKEERGMPKLISRVCNSFSSFSNKKYGRQGSPYQDIYKATRVMSDRQLLTVNYYLHANPIPLLGNKKLIEYPYSSYPNFLKKGNHPWIKKDHILNFFNQPREKNYQKALRGYLELKKDKKVKKLKSIKDLLLEPPVLF